MDKTYSETKGVPSFDWNKELDLIIATGASIERHAELTKKAANWVTCACGNQCAIIPRTPFYGNNGGCPYDDELEQLGRNFYFNIEVSDYRQAKNTLALIEKRSKYLIEIELQNLKNLSLTNETQP